MLQNVENMSPQTMARKGSKQVAGALGIVQAGTDQLLCGSGMQYPANQHVREMMEAGYDQEGGCNLISILEP